MGHGYPKHGGDKASHIAGECTSKRNALKKGCLLGHKNRPCKAAGNLSEDSLKDGKPCLHCKKSWFFSHKCVDFTRKKQACVNSWCHQKGQEKKTLLPLSVK